MGVKGNFHWRNQGFASRYEWIKSDPDRYQKHILAGRSNRKATRQWLADYKMSRGCLDCGYRVHFAALQMDHTGPKTADIGDLRSSIGRLEREILEGECVVRCANCHAIKTWCDRNGIEYNRKDFDEH